MFESLFAFPFKSIKLHYSFKYQLLNSENIKSRKY